MRPRRWWRRTPAPRTLPSHDEAREQMVRTQIEARGLTDPALLRAFRTVPRELFVESGAPYGDNALPIGQGQTISQPYIVALMTEAARPRAEGHGAGPGDRHRQRLPGGHPVGARRRSHERRAPCRPEHSSPQRRCSAPATRTCGWWWATGRKAAPENAPYDVVVVTAAGPSVPHRCWNSCGRTAGGW